MSLLVLGSWHFQSTVSLSKGRFRNLLVRPFPKFFGVYLFIYTVYEYIYIYMCVYTYICVRVFVLKQKTAKKQYL